MEQSRYLTAAIREDALAQHKLAFVSGPRQVGKSTLAKQILETSANYFLYDNEDFRREWSRSPEAALAQRGPGPIVLDELHRDRKWKIKLKGIYDRIGKELPIIVTGSARLDLYRRGSDSLMGRYFPYRMHPFSVAESKNPIGPDQIHDHKKVSFPWSGLMANGGFPEPLLRGREQESHRWSRLRLERLVLEDSRDILSISDLHAFRNLILLLPDRVGALFSVNSLREDVGKAYATVRSWVHVLEALYHCFRVLPYARLKRAVRAEPKMYLYDILQIPTVQRSKRLENLTALHLLKACQYWTDTAQGEFDLRFVRNKDGGEVDFLVLRDGRPWILVECKSNNKEPSPDLIRYQAVLKPKLAVQLVESPSFHRRYPALGVSVMGYESFFAGWV